MKCKLGEIAEITMGQSPESTHYNPKGDGLPFLQGNRTFGSRFPTFDTYTTKVTKKALAGDVIMSVRAPVGDLNFAPTDMCIGRGVCSIRMNNGNQNYLFYLLKYNIQHLMSREGGTVFGSVNKTDIAGLELEIVDEKTQIRISKVLANFDDKIELNDRINANLEAQAKAIFKSWFVDFEPFGGKMPESWTTSDIYSIAKIAYGAPFSSKLFNTDGVGIPIVRIRDLKEQKFSTFTTEEHPRGRLIRAGDIVVGMDGEFRPYLWGNDPAWLNQRICIFENKRPKGKFFLLSTIRPLLERIEKTQVGTTVIHIGKKDFDAFRIQLPDENMLNKFDELTYPLFEKIIVSLRENARLSSLRDALLPRLLSGELDVSELNI